MKIYSVSFHFHRTEDHVQSVWAHAYAISGGYIEVLEDPRLGVTVMAVRGDTWGRTESSVQLAASLPVCVPMHSAAELIAARSVKE